MLHDNLKRLRSERGLSQESVAQQLHVVRQTVSKWEKGLSVPDADMLRKIADLYDVRVSELLEETGDKNSDEIAIQLAQLNAQLLNRERRLRSFLKYSLLTVAVLLGVWLVVRFGVGFPTPTVYEETQIRLTCTLEGKTYFYSLSCDQNHRVYAHGGDPWIYENIVSPCFEQSPITSAVWDAETWITAFEDYFYQQGGTVEVEKIDPFYRTNPEFPVYAEQR